MPQNPYQGSGWNTGSTPYPKRRYDPAVDGPQPMLGPAIEKLKGLFAGGESEPEPPAEPALLNDLPFGMERGSVGESILRIPHDVQQGVLSVPEAAYAGLMKNDPNAYLRSQGPQAPPAPNSPFSAPSVTLDSLRSERGANPSWGEAPATDTVSGETSDPAIAGLKNGLGVNKGIQSLQQRPGFAFSSSNPSPDATQAAGALWGGESQFDNNQPMLSNEEMFRLAGRDPSETAPGAGAYWQTQLAGRMGPQSEERERLADIQRKSTDATLGGFGTPQAQSQAAQQMDRYKTDAPLRQQQVAGQTARDVATINQKPYDRMFDLFGMNKQGGQQGPQGGMSLGPGDTLSIPGMFSYHKGAGNNIPATLFRELTVLKNNLESGKGFFGGYDDNDLAAWQQSVGNIMANARTAADPGIRQAVFEILSDPDKAMLPLDELIDIDPSDPETQQFISLMQEIRGY